MPSNSKMNTPSQDLFFQQKGNNWRSCVKRTSVPRRALNLKDQHSKSRPSFQTRRKHLTGEENKHTIVPSTPKDRNFKSRPSLSMRRKHLTVPREENKHTNWALNPKDRIFKSQIKTFKWKINPWSRRSNQRTLHLFIYITNIRDCTQNSLKYNTNFICSQFCDYSIISFNEILILTFLPFFGVCFDLTLFYSF